MLWGRDGAGNLRGTRFRVSGSHEGSDVGVRIRGLLAGGVFALAAGLFTLDLIAQIAQTRTISLRNIHTDDVVTVEFKRNGRYVPEALERINWVMRDWRRDEQTKMDPALIDLLWEIHSELGSRQPINIISAYRSRTTNNMLRKTVGGQASESRHILGKAADVQFPDVPLKHMRYSAMVRERGGVGYYPTSATPFIHVDTDRVRAWPRMPRFELALLFPNARTQHKPADGGDISSDDVKLARARQPEVAMQLASFHDMRRNSRDQPNLMTALAPGSADIVFTPPPQQSAIEHRPPQLVAEPRVADRPYRLSTRPSDDDRRKLTQLVALVGMPELVNPPALVSPPALAARPQSPKYKVNEQTSPEPLKLDSAASPFPRLAFLSAEGIEALKGWNTGFAPSPAWDEDHPEEAAYRPFPLAQFLTTTASIDDPALAKFVHPDLSRTGEMFSNPDSVGQMKLRPGREVAQLLWSQDAAGNSVDLDRMNKASSDENATRVAFGRRVQTQTAN